MSLVLPSTLAVAPYLLLTLALAGVLAIYIALKREIAAQSKRNRRVEAMLMRLQEATPARLSQKGAAVSSEEGLQAGPSFGPPGFGSSAMSSFGMPRPGMNLNRRVQALRLLRRGENLEHIAAALGVPRCEIELLVRIQQLTATGGNEETGGPAPSNTQTASTGT